MAQALELEYLEDTPKKSDKAQEQLKAKLDVIRKGLSVDVVDISYCEESESTIIVKARIMTDVNGIPSFNELKLKLTKQAARKLGNNLTKLLVKDQS